MKFIVDISENSSHPIWIGLQFVGVRLLTAVKFLLVAKLLGPVVMGHVSVALLGLASMEALTDLGLGQAIIQQTGIISLVQRHTVWTLLLIRGFLIGLTMALLAPWLSMLMGSSGAVSLLYICALVPLIRNMAGINIYIIQRDRNFKLNSFLTTLPSFVDFSLSLGLTLITKSPYGMFLGLIAGESVKTILSFALFRDKPIFKLSLDSIKEMNTYGRWIWASSLVTFFLNQSDKVVAGSIFGSYNLGIYQMSSRTAQLGISDLATAASQYLFPTFAEKFRQDSLKSEEFFKSTLSLSILVAIMIILIEWLSASAIITVLLGNEWKQAIPIFRILSISMGIGGIIAILVAYIRAIGQPKWITYATILQMLFYIPSVFLLSRYYGITGLAYSNIISTATTALYLLISAFFFSKRDITFRSM